MSDPARIAERASELLAPRDLAGVRVLVTAGGTREAIDTVRYLGNRSSGKMGFAVARRAARRGAEVVLVSGPSALRRPPVCGGSTWAARSRCATRCCASSPMPTSW
jgi:phosphopantothenoylcysteine decarboxylase/phosphopantothenate--cysteine ligase